MRRLLTTACAGAALGATLDAAEGTIGLLMVTGGSQTRIGSHRMYESLSTFLVDNGFSCLRYDRRGVGDSGGEDPGYRSSGPDLAAAAALLRAEQPALRRLIGFGLCDGATSLALFAGAAGLDGLILVNPWLVEAESDAPPPAAIRRHYRERLTSLAGWKKALSGDLDLGKLLRGLKSIAAPRAVSSLGLEVKAALRRSNIPAVLILAAGDATAIAAEAETESLDSRRLFTDVRKLPTDSHTFARPGDDMLLAQAVLDSLRRLEG